MLDSGAPEWQAEGMVGVHGVFAAGYAASTTDTVKDVTGKEPRTLAAFAADHAAFFAGAAAG